MSLYHGDNSYVTIVDSDLRISGTATNFSYNLRLPVNNYNRICLKSISIPRSFYDFTTGYNTFQLKEKTTTVTITVTPGYYTKNSLIAVLSTLLTTASPNGWIYSVSYPGYTSANPNTLTFSVSGNGTFQPSVIFTTNCYLQLGFNSNSTNLFTSSSLTSVNTISITYINQLLLKSSACSSSFNSILSEIFITGQYPSGSFIYYEPVDIDVNSREFINNNNNVYDFQLTDKNGLPISLNGLGFIFSLIVYTKDNTNELQKDYLQIKNLEKL